MNDGVIGCICQNDGILDAAVAALVGTGLPNQSLHVGAADENQATAAAQRLGIVADLLADDPLRGLIEPHTEAETRAAVDKAGVVGAALGAALGIAIGLSPAGRFVTAPPGVLVMANAGLYFVLGAITGSVLGAALAPQPSTHVGFRLIDGMQEGSYALIAVAPRDRHDSLQRALEAAGGSGITRI